jgi:hypothetical protein
MTNTPNYLSIIKQCARVNIVPYRDLLDQCGGRSVILIEGHALLDYLIEQCNVNFEYGFSAAHLTERLELYVGSMRELQVNFHVVFFDEYCNVRTDRNLLDDQGQLDFQVSFTPLSPTKRVAVQLMIQELQKRKCSVRCFNSWINNDKWDNFIREKQPAFLIGNRDSQLLMYYMHIFKKVLFVTNIEFYNNTIRGFSTAAENNVITVHVEHEDHGDETDDENLSNLLVHEEFGKSEDERVFLECALHFVNQAHELAPHDVYQEFMSFIPPIALNDMLCACSHPLFHEQGGKLTVLLYACCCLISTSTPLQRIRTAHLSQLFLTTTLLQGYLTHRERAQIFGESGSHSELVGFQNNLFHIFSLLLSDETKSEKPTPELFDIADGRLFHAVIRSYLIRNHGDFENIVLEDLEVPKYLQDVFEIMQKIIRDVVVSCITEPNPQDIEFWAQIQEHFNTKLYTPPHNSKYVVKPIENDLVRAYLQDWDEKFSHQDNESNITETYTADALHHHDYTHIDDEKKLSYSKKEQQDRLLRTLHETSESMARRGKIKKRVIEGGAKKISSVLRGSRKNQVKQVTQDSTLFAGEKFIQWDQTFVKQSVQASSDLSARESVVSLSQSEIKMKKAKSKMEEMHQNFKNKKINVDDIVDLLTEVREEILRVRIYVYTEWSSIKSTAKKAQYLTKLKHLSTNDEIPKKEDLRTIKLIFDVEKELVEDLLLPVLLQEFRLKAKLCRKDHTEDKAWHVFESGCLLIRLVEHLKDTKRIGRSLPIEDAHSITSIVLERLHQIGFTTFAANIAQINDIDLSHVKPSKWSFNHLVLQLRYTTFGAETASYMNLIEENNSVHRIVSDTRRKNLSQEQIEEIRMNEQLGDLGFKPDLFQVLMIDAVKSNKSALVCAPASAGKTFFTMILKEMVLRQSVDGVFVYVSPNKELINQMFCSVNARYTKKYDDNEHHMLGCYTADIQRNVKNSQILLTVPACLENLLMGTSADSIEWRKRLRYVIFDEVHCISGQDSQAQSWVNCIRMIECPFVALSATIGNCEQFGQWLALHKKETDFVLITEKKRPRPVEFYNYVPSTENSLVMIHPCAAFNKSVIDVNEIKNMIPMSPRQCLHLLDVSKVVHRDLNLNGEHLFSEYEPGAKYGLTHDTLQLASRDEFNLYQQRLHQRLIDLGESGNHDKILATMFKLLRFPVDESFKELHQVAPEREFISHKFVGRHITDLTVSLKANRKLPCIMFVLDKHRIEKMVKKLLMFHEQYPNFSLWSSDTERSNALLLIRPVIKELGCKLCRDTEQDPLQCDHEEQYVDKFADDIYLKALTLGIAVHYKDMSAEYKNQVERLYRETDQNGVVIPIIIATSTLALGVHMPARTVVMCGASIYLDNTLFTQMYGRSGRRGYEDVGNVVMFGFTQVQVNRYMTASTTHIAGPCGLTVSSVLRLMNLYWFAHDRKYILDSCLRVLNFPLFLRRERSLNIDNQMKHQFRFAIELLRRLDYLGLDGRPLKYAGFVVNMSYNEPANFLIVTLLQSKILDNILAEHWDEMKVHIKHCNEIIKEIKLLRQTRYTLKSRPKKTQEDRTEIEKVEKEIDKMDNSLEYIKEATRFPVASLKELLHIFCYLIGRRKVFKRSHTVRRLAPLDSSVVTIIRDFNQLAGSVFTEYVNSYARSHSHEIEETTLPLSGQSLCFSNISRTDNANALINDLRNTQLEYYSVSSFAALSGNTDNYQSVNQLLSTVNHNIVLDRSIIPSADIEDPTIELNSYIMDLYDHGDINRLIEENGMVNKNTVVNEVRQFIKQLAKVRSSIEKLEGPHAGVAEAIGQILDGLNQMLYNGHTEVSWSVKRKYEKQVMDGYRKHKKEVKEQEEMERQNQDREEKQKK